MIFILMLLLGKVEYCNFKVRQRFNDSDFDVVYVDNIRNFTDILLI